MDNNSDDITEDLIEKLDRSISKKRSELEKEQFFKSCNDIISTLKTLEKDVKELKKLYRNKEKVVVKKKKVKKDTFLTKEVQVPKNICTIINVPEGTTLKKPDVTKRVHKYFRDNQLYHPDDKRILRVDSKISKAFGIPFSVNKSTDAKDKNGLNIFNIQKYISNSYK